MAQAGPLGRIQRSAVLRRAHRQITSKLTQAAFLHLSLLVRMVYEPADHVVDAYRKQMAEVQDALSRERFGSSRHAQLIGEKMRIAEAGRVVLPAGESEAPLGDTAEWKLETRTARNWAGVLEPFAARVDRLERNWGSEDPLVRELLALMPFCGALRASMLRVAAAPDPAALRSDPGYDPAGLAGQLTPAVQAVLTRRAGLRTKINVFLRTAGQSRPPAPRPVAKNKRPDPPLAKALVLICRVTLAAGILTLLAAVGLAIASAAGGGWPLLRAAVIGVGCTLVLVSLAFVASGLLTRLNNRETLRREARGLPA